MFLVPFLSLSAIIIGFMLFNVWMAMAVIFLCNSVGIISAINMYLVNNFWLVYCERKFHHHEFKKHYKKQVSLAIITFVCMATLMLANLITSTITFCVSQNNGKNEGAFY